VLSFVEGEISKPFVRLLFVGCELVLYRRVHRCADGLTRATTFPRHQVIQVDAVLVLFVRYRVLNLPWPNVDLLLSQCRRDFS
jgi:hypothetical protein